MSEKSVELTRPVDEVRTEASSASVARGIDIQRGESRETKLSPALLAARAARANERAMLWLGVVFPVVLGALESVIRSAAQNEDRATFFPPSLAAAAVALFLPLAFAPIPFINIRWRTLVLGFVRYAAIALGFVGLAVWAVLLEWAIRPTLVPAWAQWLMDLTQLGGIGPALGTALIYYVLSVLFAYVRNGVMP